MTSQTKTGSGEGEGRGAGAASLPRPRRDGSRVVVQGASFLESQGKEDKGKGEGGGEKKERWHFGENNDIADR